MAWNGNDGAIEHAIERGFSIEVEGHVVPGVYWQPKQGTWCFWGMVVAPIRRLITF